MNTSLHKSEKKDFLATVSINIKYALVSVLLSLLCYTVYLIWAVLIKGIIISAIQYNTSIDVGLVILSFLASSSLLSILLFIPWILITTILTLVLSSFFVYKKNPSNKVHIILLNTLLTPFLMILLLIPIALCVLVIYLIVQFGWVREPIGVLQY